MISIITRHHHELSAALEDDLGRYRHEVFIQQLGWQLDSTYALPLHAHAGRKCTECNLSLHKACHGKVLQKCRGAAAVNESVRQNNDELARRFKINVPHDFQPHTFRSPTFCHHCGSLLWGLRKQGLKCTHKNCGQPVRARGLPRFRAKSWC